MDTEVPRVFISYSHDSVEQKKRVLALANRLLDDGVDAWIDQYEEGPHEGWPRWMDRQIAEANFVLLVCTENYHERVMMRTPKEKGHGVLWESNLIYQHLYEAGTVNAKFIPVLLPEGGAQHIPTVLRGVQRYEPFTEDGYWTLYRRVTAQPSVSKPPLGQRKALPQQQPKKTESPPAPPKALVVCSSSPRAAIISERDHLQAFIPVVESNWDEQEATLVLEPDLPDDGAFLDGLRGSRSQLLLAFRNNAAVAHVEGVQHRTESGTDRWRLTVRIRQSDFSTNMEMNTTGLTADDAAVLRARRVLLHVGLADPEGNMNDVLREIIIAGQGTAIEVKGSPFPLLYKALRGHPQMFVEAAWVLAVLHLKASAAIEHVTTFALELVGNELQVQFSGRRAKKYTNLPAFKVEVSGTCPL